MSQTSLGNAYRVMLPEGTKILLPTEVSFQQVRAVAVNETIRDGDRAVVFTQPLQLVSPAYITERNETEKRYAHRIAELEEQLRAATTK